MKNLTYKIVSIDKKVGDAYTSQLTSEEKRALVSTLAQTGATHLECTFIGDTDAACISHGHTPSPRTLAQETQDWYDIIHAQPNVYGSSVYGGYLKVVDRTLFQGIQGINSFPFDTTTPTGTAISAPTDGQTTWCGRWYDYLYNRVTTAKVQTGDIMCPIPEITGTAFGGHFFTTQAGAIALCGEMQKITTNFGLASGQSLIYMSNPNFSEVTSGYWSGYGSQGNVVCFDYYGNNRGNASVTPTDYVFDLSQTFAGISLAGYGIPTTGLQMVWMEWGDLSGSIKLLKGSRTTGDNFVVGTTNEIDWAEFNWSYFKAIRDNLVNTSPVRKLKGYSWWGGWEAQNTSLVWKTGSGVNSKYYLNWRGQMLASFYINDGILRLPVVQGGPAYTEASTSFGGRDRYW